MRWVRTCLQTAIDHSDVLTWLKRLGISSCLVLISVTKLTGSSLLVAALCPIWQILIALGDLVPQGIGCAGTLNLKAYASACRTLSPRISCGCLLWAFHESWLSVVCASSGLRERSFSRFALFLCYGRFSPTGCVILELCYFTVFAQFLPLQSFLEHALMTQKSSISAES